MWGWGIPPSPELGYDATTAVPSATAWGSRGIGGLEALLRGLAGDTLANLWPCSCPGGSPHPTGQLRGALGSTKGQGVCPGWDRDVAGARTHTHISQGNSKGRIFFKIFFSKSLCLRCYFLLFFVSSTMT